MKTMEEILSLESAGVLSLVGGGGKTSLMFHLARRLSRAGKRVLTTTTTKIFVPTPEQSATVLIDAAPAAILSRAASALRETSHITAAASLMDDAGKLKGFEPEAIGALAESGLFDWILVEADGSARRPLKAPAGHEPAVPPATDILVAVAGLDVLGAPLTEEVVFRSELAGRAMGLSKGEIVTEPALAALLAHPLGAFKGAPPQARRFIFLNKGDDPRRRDGGARVAAQLRTACPDVAEALIVGQALEDIRIHAVYPLGAAP